MKIVGVFLCLCAPILGSSVRLYNDSPYPLRAVVQGSDGTALGEVLVQPNNLMVWSDAGSQMGYHEPTRSETPFTVLWYCEEGAPYSVCSQVPNASMVTAQTCLGNRQCKTPPPTPLKIPNGEPQTEFYQYQGPGPSEQEVPATEGTPASPGG